MRARDNPFATVHMMRLPYQFHDGADNWPSLLSRLALLDYRAAIIGPHGAGKSTLLDELGSRLQNSGFRTLPLFRNDQHRSYPTDFLMQYGPHLTEHDIILLDGCEQLGWLNWRRFFWQTRRAGGLIITAHRAGRLPTLKRCHTDPALLADLIDQLTGQADSMPETGVRQLFHKHRGNVREAMRELYDTTIET